MVRTRTQRQENRRAPDRRGLIPGLFLTLLAAASPAFGDQNDPRLDPLFSALRQAEDVTKARRVEAGIWRIWSQYGDDPIIDRMMRHGARLMAAEQMKRAAEVFDQVVTRAPAFAEGWNRRATLRFLTGDFDGSVADIRQVLNLEPRHFGALSGLGLIYMALERPQGALKAFERALQINPHMTSARRHAANLRAQLKGQRL
ncbi:MAG: tetratricopeptide repeat protein [Pseudomonadota bacterium]|nr:tetratricopeptide repeat protein [Pseudomonadota bacterium]